MTGTFDFRNGRVPSDWPGRRGSLLLDLIRVLAAAGGRDLVPLMRAGDCINPGCGCPRSVPAHLSLMPLAQSATMLLPS